MTKVHYDWQVTGTAPLTTGSGSAYVVARPDHVLDASPIYFQAHIANLANPTIDVGGTGALPIVYDDNTGINAGELKLNAIYSVVWNNTWSAYVLQKSVISQDPETFISIGTTFALGSGYSDDKDNWLVQYGSNITLITGNGQVYKKAVAGPAISEQKKAQATLGIGVYGGTMIYQGYGYILDKNNGNNILRVDLTSDLAVLANWNAVTVGHTRTYTSQHLLGIDGGKVYILDFNTSGAVVKRFDFGGLTWTYEADQFICNDLIGNPILGANAEGVANSQGITISWEAINLEFVRYDYAGNVLSSFGDVSIIGAPGHFRALPNTQYSSLVDNAPGGIQVYRRFDF